MTFPPPALISILDKLNYIEQERMGFMLNIKIQIKSLLINFKIIDLYVTE